MKSTALALAVALASSPLFAANPQVEGVDMF